MSDINSSSTTAKETTWAALFSAGNGLKATVLALGVMLHATNVYLATTIMPSIIGDIGGLAFYAWTTTVFVVASVIGSVLSANQMVISGPKRAYQIAIGLFAIGTVLCTIAPSMHVLLFGRFIQGYGGGLMFALSYAMIRLVFTPNLWSRAMALVSGMWGIAAFSGPFIGGVFAEYGHWRWAFGSLLIFCVFIFVVASLVLPQRKDQQRSVAIPYFKLALLAMAILAVSVGSIQTKVIDNILGVGLALLLLVVLVWLEKKKALRLLPTGAYSITSALGATYAIMALLTIATSIEIYVPYFAQILYHFTPLKAGYLTVLIAFGWTFSSLYFSSFNGNMVRTIIVSGVVLVFIGLAGLSYVTVVELSSVWNLLLQGFFLLFIGIGIGMGWPHLLTKVFSLAPKGEEDLTSSSVTTVQLIATSFGTAIAGLVTNLGGITNAHVEGVKNAAVWLYGSFTFAPLLAFVILLLSRRKIK